MFEFYKRVLDDCWAVHSYGNLHRYQNHMIATVCAFYNHGTVRSWFPDARGAAFFRDAMHMLRNQTQDGEFITYETLSTLFRKHINLAKESHDSSVTPN